MTKTIVAAAPDPEGRKCTKHNILLKHSETEKVWYCPECLRNAHNSWKAQQEAVRRYRNSDKGKEAQDRYENSDKGQAARNRYLKSSKYKQRRKEYNQRLQESLQIAREAKKAAPRVHKVLKALPPNLPPLVTDILEYQDLIGRSPSTADVKEWSVDLYKKHITTEQARKLIKQAEGLTSG